MSYENRWNMQRDKDKGCYLYHSCLSCPFSTCIFEGREKDIEETLSISSREAADYLGISVRHVNRLRQKYRESKRVPQEEQERVY